MSRAQITVVLLVVLCGAVIYAWVATPRQRRITDGQVILQQRQRIQKKKIPSDFPTVTDLDISGEENRQYQAPKKNIFGPLYLPPKQVPLKPVKRRPAPPAAKVTKPVEPPRQIAPVVIQPRSQPRGPEPIQSLNVLGYLNKAGDYTVFLASKQGRVFLVKTGDAFADDLIVLSISNKEITVGRKQTDQQIVLRLSEAKSQRLPNVKFQSNRPAFVMPKEPETYKPELNTGKPTLDPNTFDPADATKAEHNKGDN